jgi:chromate reductase
MTHSIAIIVGSLRRESFNRRLAQALTRLPAAQGHGFGFVEIGTLPLYNQDDDSQPSAATQAMKAAIRAASGVMFVTPEYNRSLPGVLKNALDHGSRPHGDSCWAGKPAAVIGTSQGAIATALAQLTLRTVLAYLDMVVLTQPEAYVRWTDGLVGEDGTLQGSTGDFLDGWMKTFLALVDVHAG